MFFNQLQTFNGLAYGQRATAMVQPMERSLGRVQLQLGGAITKAAITELVMRVGSQQFFGPISGTDLDKLMKFRGEFDIASSLNLDLCERNLLSVSDKLLGALDLTSIAGQAVFVEVVNNLGAGVLTLTGEVGYVDRQYFPENPEKSKRRNLLVHKLTRFAVPNSGSTRVTWNPPIQRELIKRLHFSYAGTDFTSSTNGNLHTVSVRRKGVPIHDRVKDLSNRYSLQTHGLVPQSRWYSIDFIADRDLGSAIPTNRYNDLEVELEFTAADSVTCYAETLGVIDLPQ
jgi:hypothetical protein